MLDMNATQTPAAFVTNSTHARIRVGGPYLLGTSSIVGVYGLEWPREPKRAVL